MHYSREIILNDCPNCGSKAGAFMGSRAWGHSITCCSDKCGEEIQAKLLKNEEKPEYKKMLKKIYKLRSKALEIRYKGIDAIEPFFEI